MKNFKKDVQMERHIIDKEEDFLSGDNQEHKELREEEKEGEEV
jgi:hypothetical protein